MMKDIVEAIIEMSIANTNDLMSAAGPSLRRVGRQEVVTVAQLKKGVETIMR